MDINDLRARHRESYEKKKADLQNDIADAQRAMQQVQNNPNIPEKTDLKEKLKQSEGKDVVITYKTGEKKQGQLTVKTFASGMVRVGVKGEQDVKLQDMTIESIVDAQGNTIFKEPENAPSDWRTYHAMLFGKESLLQEAGLTIRMNDIELQTIQNDRKKFLEDIDKLPQIYKESYEFIPWELRNELDEYIEKYFNEPSGVEWILNSLEVCKALHDGASVEEANAKAGHTPDGVLLNMVLDCSLEGEAYYDKYCHFNYDKGKKARVAERNRLIVGLHNLKQAQREADEAAQRDSEGN